MSHTVTIKLIGNQTINVGDKEINLHDIESIEIIDNYRVNKVKFKKENEK
jgi:hypothetical protein